MILKILGISLFIMTILFTASFSYSIDLRYISFGQKDKKPEIQNNITENLKNERIMENSIDISAPLTLKQCIEFALKNSPTMKVAKISLDQEDMNILDAKSNYLPQVNVSGSYMFSDDIDFGWEKENYNSSLDASYTIWDHGQRKSTLEQAKVRKESEKIRYLRTSQSLIFSVIRAYYGLLEAEKLIAVDEQLLDLSKRDVEKIKAYIENGWAIEADLATARVQQANNELTLINDLNNLEIARANLAVIIGMESEAQINVIDDPDYELYEKRGLIETEQVSIEDIKSQAMKSRPELIELNANRRILEIALNLANLERLPRLTAEASYNFMLDDYLRERDAIKNYKNWSAQARLSFPLFDAGRSKRTVEKAELALKELEENRLELEQSIGLEVRQAYLDFERSKKSLDISSVQVEDAKMSLDITQGRYELREATLLELLDVQARYARSLTNRVKAFYDYKVARRSLEKAMGIIQ